MRGVRVFICLLLAFGQLLLNTQPANAISTGGVVIAQVNPGLNGAATQEFIELYNNSTQPVDVSGWCVYYSSATNVTSTKLGCLTQPNSATAIWLKAGGYIKVISNDYKNATGAAADIIYTTSMAAAGGHVRLLDKLANEIDRVGWGTAVNPETTATSAPTSSNEGKSLLRKMVNGALQDTDNNQSDFNLGVATPHAPDTYEVVTVIDVCPNIDGVQPVVPTNYMTDINGNCEIDSCLNINGLQVSVPAGYDADQNGNCILHDECDNVVGIQATIPQYMVRSNDNDCSWELPQIMLTELLPNSVGSDTGNEFIEIFNPTNETVDLSYYSIKTGINSDKTYSFPVGSTIAPGEYRAFNDSMMKFTLLNTSGRVVLTASDESIYGDSGEYVSPVEGESWALINGVWQYTNQPTPGAENKPSLVEDKIVDVTDGNVAPCPAGKYRNPLTNRCRNITTDASVFASCEADQYRNPETGRCKKIVTAMLTPCKDGQYRSEETNRCRNIVTASTSKPCKDNQYRSEETGRCRNLSASTVPDAAFAVQPVKDTGMAFVGWWALGGLGILAAGYAAWEWRREILTFINSLTKR